MVNPQRASAGRRPVIFGEVLFDTFPDGTSVLGGAPFNVAWHLQGFGLAPLFVSRVGSDTRGREVLDTMQAWGMDITGVQTDLRHPTGQVSVSLRDGQPSYDILPGQAYDAIDGTTAVDALVGDAPALLYHGTLAARSPVSRAGLESLIARSALPTFVDINLRPPWWDAGTVAKTLQAARWLKLNDEELTAMVGAQTDADGLVDAAAALRARHDLELVVLTLGAQGAWFITADARRRGTPVPVENLVDTVGAGDGFAAVTLCGLLQGWPLALTLERALAFAARLCAQRGATARNRELYAACRTEWTR